MQAQPLEVRAFVDHPAATARTKTHGNPAFAGSIGFMGHVPRVTSKARTADTAEEIRVLLRGAAAASGIGVLAEANDAGMECVACAVLGHTHDHALHADAAGVGFRHAHPGHETGQHEQGNTSLPAASGERFDVELDLTRAVRAASADSKQVALTLVAVDIDGNEVSGTDVRFDEIEIVVD
jgi:hypothetical protein